MYKNKFIKALNNMVCCIAATPVLAISIVVLLIFNLFIGIRICYLSIFEMSRCINSSLKFEINQYTKLLKKIMVSETKEPCSKLFIFLIREKNSLFDGT